MCRRDIYRSLLRDECLDVRDIPHPEVGRINYHS